MAEEKAKDNFVEILADFLDGDLKERRNQVRKFFGTHPDFDMRGSEKLTVQQLRDQTSKKARIYFEQPFLDLSTFKKNFNNAFDISDLNMLATDLNFGIKTGVHCLLFIGSLHNLGTEYHWNKYFPKSQKFEEPGSFCMTEIGHGSNVKMLQTIAKYDKETRTFDLHTPVISATKMYIGNGFDSVHSIVFARLIIGEKDHGVHAFVVKLRDKPRGPPLPGIKVEDCGIKMGANGMDNAFIAFDHVKIPKEDMLNRFGDIDDSGTYHSSIKKKEKRFTAMLSALFVTRVGVVTAAVGLMRFGCAVALKYGRYRLQFGPDKLPEIPIGDFLTHQTRLIPLLAHTYAHGFMSTHVKNILAGQLEGMTPAYAEVLVSGFKAVTTWKQLEVLQTARECCGGAGFMAENRIGEIRRDSDIQVTFEGDNTVLLQQVAKYLLVQFRRQYASGWTSLFYYFMNEFYTETIEKNYYKTSQTSESHFRDIHFQKNTLAFVESRLIFRCAKLLQKYMKEAAMKHKGSDPKTVNGKNGFYAWNHTLPFLIPLAKVHMDRVILDVFWNNVQKCEDEKVRATLKDLCDLFALDSISSHLEMLLEKNYAKNYKSVALKKFKLELIKSLNERAIDLVDAWRTPERVMDLPMFHQHERQLFAKL